MPTSARLASVKRIQDLYTKLSKEALVSEELEELVRLTTDLHESAVILRYKAAEERVFDDKKVVPTEEVAPVQEKQEKPIEMEKPIDFSIFEQTVTEVQAEETLETERRDLDFDNKAEEKPIEPEVSIVSNVSQEPNGEMNTDWISYFQKVLKDHSSGLQTPLRALAGSFGLNERILYINELFSKEAESFSETIQKLDALSDWETCMKELTQIANARDWDKENDTTGEFVLHVKRRYE